MNDIFIDLQIKVKKAPLFELCGSEDEGNANYFLFPNSFNYWFYKSWRYNQGGEIAVPLTDENYHELMDIAESMVDAQTHEKVHSCIMIQIIRKIIKKCVFWDTSRNDQ